MRKENLIWQKFWRLLVVWEWERKKYKWWSKSTYLCKCDCGNYKSIEWWSLTREKWNTTSCWCYNMERITKHWMWWWKWKNKERFYSIYNWLKSRCQKDNIWHAKWYYDKWIRCLRPTFIEFKSDMYDEYLEHSKIHWEDNTTIDRIDNNWNYCKENCRWATKQIQAENKSTTIFCTYNWETHSMAERMRILLHHKEN